MKKFWVMVTMVFVITGFASTAFAGEGKYIFEKMHQDAEKRLSTTQNQQTNDLPYCHDVSKESSTKTE
jgi:hypothetical protein